MTQTIIEDDVQEIEKRIDHGGTFLTWDDDPNETIQKGIAIDTLLCNNPKCTAIHIRAILVDEQVKNKDDSEIAQLFVDHFDTNTNKNNLPNQSLLASFDVETEKLKFQCDKDIQAKNKELIYLLRKLTSKGLSDVFKRRWRLYHPDKNEIWKEKDWSWLNPGQLVGWDDVYPDDFNFMFKLGDKSYFARDLYCITPGCQCKEVAFVFFSMQEKNQSGAIFIDTEKLKVNEVHPKISSKQDLLEFWDKINVAYPDMRERLQKRYKEMKRVGEEITKMSGNFKAPVMAKTKVKRNAPCPCGSGKKYKKCCGIT